MNVKKFLYSLGPRDLESRRAKGWNQPLIKGHVMHHVIHYIGKIGQRIKVIVSVKVER